jgi:hypothetical protein
MAESAFLFVKCLLTVVCVEMVEFGTRIAQVASGFQYSLSQRPMRQHLALLLAATFSVAAPVHAQYTTFTDRLVFESFLGTKDVDDFSAPGYSSIMSSATMNAVRGQTAFTPTQWSGFNLVMGGAYCAGCNGSFRLGFGNTDFGGSTGVYGAGFDYLYNDNVNPYHAFVTFGDGSTANFALGAGNGFIGFTSWSMISSIHLGATNGAATGQGYLMIDNLTIGESNEMPQETVRLFTASFEEEWEEEVPFNNPPVTTAPEPASVALMAAGLAGVAVASRRRKRQEKGGEEASA